MASQPSLSAAHETSSSARAADRARLAKLDAEIDALEILLRTVHTQRKRVKARLDSYKYPVFTLPNEIVSEIFTRVLPVYPLCPPAISPTLLSSVCRKWRDVALSTPTLWRAISIRIPVHPHISKLPLLETWLARSQSCPLSISLADNRYAEASDSEMAPFIQAILPHCNRWEYLSLLVADPDAFSQIQGDMPLLRHLQIGVTPFMTHTVTNVDPVVLFQDAAQLQTVTLLSSLPPEITLPWAQLTRLVAQTADPDMCSRVLEHAPNLIYCKVQLRGYHWQIGWVQRHLAYLEILILEDVGSTGHQLNGLIESLTLPALRKLHVPRKFLLPDSAGALEAFIARSGCKLEELYIIGPHDMSAEDYREIFPSIPTLEMIEVNEYYDQDNDDDNPELDFDN
ncbi:hypothetical protein B0H11DRAFT_951179 [Mycena galericulata]|nr:hypothetical protein B0H11DRAFT_951179 [Mycena galericulata]